MILSQRIANTTLTLRNIRIIHTSEKQTWLTRTRPTIYATKMHFSTKQSAVSRQPSNKKTPDQTCWISLFNAPRFASLNEILESMSKTINSMPKSDENLPLPSPIILEARLKLSKLQQPCGWFIRLPTTSITRDILEHTKSHPPLCAWSQLSVAPFYPERYPQEFEMATKLGISETSVKIDNVEKSVTVEDLQFLFRRWEVRKVERLTMPDYFRDTKSFLVDFEDLEGAQAAVRDFQTRHLFGNKMKLYPYPNQLLQEDK
mmetsp:Transcript_31685/g.38819  ORF Transcript_31685/g.38819 Transcript_31685/m.38819 type:complete len:260 (-) Transcript_31685:22-801(-)